MTHEQTITYDEIEAAVAVLGGIGGLLLMLPAVAPEMSEAEMGAIRKGIEDRLPVDIAVSLPGVGYLVHLRASRDAG